MAFMRFSPGARAGQLASWRSVTGGALLAVMATAATVSFADMPGPGMRGPHGPEALFFGPPERVLRHVDHLLDGLSATDAQRSEIKQIVQAAADDLRAQHSTVRSLHERSLAIFSAPTVDAAAAESVRQQLQSQQDQSSRRVLQAMLDMSRVLTPEQRATMASRAQAQQSRREQHMQRSQPDSAR